MKKNTILACCAMGFAVAHAQTVLPWADYSAAERAKQALPIRSIAMSERPGDTTLEALDTKDGTIQVAGRISKNNGSMWATLGVEVGHSADTQVTNMSAYKNIRIRLSAPQKRIVRIRLKGKDAKLLRSGCYPVMMQQIGPVPTDYIIPLASFESEHFCGSEGITPEATLTDLMAVEVTVNEPSDDPVRFTVGNIDFIRTGSASQTATAPAPAAAAAQTPRIERSADWKLAWSDDFDGGVDGAKWIAQRVADSGGRVPQSKELGADSQGHAYLRPLTADTSIRLQAKPTLAMLYGRMEVTFKAPTSSTANARIVLIGSPLTDLSWPDSGGIVLADLNGGSNSLWLGVEGPGMADDSGLQLITRDDSFATQYHTVALEWEPGHLRWLLDDQLVKDLQRAQLPAAAKLTYDQWPYQLQLSAGATTADKSAEEAALLIDSVRVYKRPDLVTAAAAKLAAWQAKATATPAVEKAPSPSKQAKSSSTTSNAPAVAPTRQVTCSRDNKYGLLLCN